MITSEMKQKFGTIVPYSGAVYIGRLNLSHPQVIEMANEVLRLFLNAPPAHFIGTFLYFYHVAPDQENPITVSAFDDTIATHPGQGRLLASYMRGDSSIDAIMIPLHEKDIEVQALKKVSNNFKYFNETVYNYDNQNHHGISTKNFELYFYPTDVRLSYEKEKDKLLYEKLDSYLPVLWKFKDRPNIQLGKGKVKTVVKCKTPKGFYESVAHLSLGHFKNSNNYSIKYKQ